MLWEGVSTACMVYCMHARCCAACKAFEACDAPNRSTFHAPQCTQVYVDSGTERISPACFNEERHIAEGGAGSAGNKYTVKVTRQGPEFYRLHLGPSYVDAVARHLKDGGLLVQVCRAGASPRWLSLSAGSCSAVPCCGSAPAYELLGIQPANRMGLH